MPDSARLFSATIANWLDTNLLNLANNDELNISTTLSFFNWIDTSLDDVEMLLK